MSTSYAEFQRGRGISIVVAVETFRGVERIDLRVWHTYPDGTRQPTRKGVSMPLDALPRLIAALQQIELDAIADGRLRAGDYILAELPMPGGLLPAE